MEKVLSAPRPQYYTAVALILKRGSGVAKFQISVARKDLRSMNELSLEKIVVRIGIN